VYVVVGGTEYDDLRPSMELAQEARNVGGAGTEGNDGVCFFSSLSF